MGRPRHRAWLILCAAAAALLAFPAVSSAQLDGSLDTAFDGPSGTGNGKFTYAFNSQAAELNDMALQSDGKIVAVGTVDTDLTAGLDQDLLLVRFNVNGSLDTSFDGPTGSGNGAVVIHPTPGDTQGQAIAIDSSGAIVVAGQTDVSASNLDQFVMRFDRTDGDLDGTFGSGGFASATFSAGDEFALDVTVDKFDRPITVGHALNDLAIARFEADGDPDNTFGGDGMQAIDVNGSDVGLGIGIVSGSKILVTGRSSANNGDLELARLDPSDGSLDPSFDGPAAGTSTAFPGNGTFSLPLSPGSGFDEGRAIVSLGASGFVIGGASGVDTSFALVKFDAADGDLDTSFGGDGVVTTDFGTGLDQIYDLERDSKGRFVAAGQATGANVDFAAARYEADGDLDPFFDGDSGTGNGKVSFGISGTHDRAYALDLESDGDIVLAGESNTAPNTGALARLKVDLVEPNTFTSGPSGPTNDANPVFSITSNETASSVQCTLDAAPVACTTGGSQQFGPFADGEHTLTAAAVDQSGNLDSVPATRTFTVDTDPPDASISSGTGLTNDSTPSLTFTADEGGVAFQCRLDPAAGPPGSFAPCTSPFTPTGALGDGSYTLLVRATDAAGNQDPSDASGAFTIDTIVPVARVTGGPPASAKTKKGRLAARFTFDSDDAAATFRCALDGAAFAACGSPFAATLRKGRHTFSVRATDAAGNESAPATRTVTVKKKKAKRRR